MDGSLQRKDGSVGRKDIGLKKRVRGSVTLFFVMIMGTVVLLFGVLFFLAEKNRAETQGAKILEVSAEAVLAEFDRPIEEKFGFYAVSDEKKAEKALSFFLKENTFVSGPVFMDDMQVVRVQTKNVSNLSDQAEIKKQIHEFMKVRGLIELTDLVLQQLKEVKSGAEKAQEELRNYGGMEAYNRAYLRVVELLEGVRDDGTKTNQSIRRYEGKVLPKGKTPDFKDVSFLLSFQKLYEANEDLKYALKDLRLAAESIEAKDRDLLPLDAREVKGLESVRTTNSVLLYQMLTALNEEEVDAKIHQAHVSTAYLVLKDRYRELHVKYEIHEKTTYSITELKKAIFGEAANLKEYAPNEDRLDGTGEIYRGLPSKGGKNALDATDLEAYSEELYQMTGFLPGEAVFRAEFMLYISGMLPNLRDTISEAKGDEVLNMRQRAFVKGLFNNETEYLYFGSVNEYHNVEAVKAGMISFRTVLNMATLLSDSDKMGLIRSLASSTGGCVVPGIGEKVIEVLLVTAWSLWEASSDWNALLNGKKIALIKMQEEWKTDLDSILGTLVGKSDAPESRGAQGNQSLDALDYEAYLVLLMAVVPTDTLIGRLQDLIYLERGGRPLNKTVCGFVADGMYETAGLRFSFERFFSY